MDLDNETWHFFLGLISPPDVLSMCFVSVESPLVVKVFLCDSFISVKPNQVPAKELGSNSMLLLCCFLSFFCLFVCLCLVKSGKQIFPLELIFSTIVLKQLVQNTKRLMCLIQMKANG